MIIKGAARGNPGWLAGHLARTDTNEVAEVLEIRGVVAGTLLGAFREIAATALCTKARDPLYHANIDPHAAEEMTPERWARAVDALEKKLGFQDQPRVVVRHVKEGREHYHVVWSRIDVENRRSISDSHNYRKHEEVARALEREFGHARVQGALAERDGVPRPGRAPSRAEMQQAERSGLDPKAIKAELSGLWGQTDTGKAFAAAVEDAGYCLAQGDKRDFIIVDQAGEVHSLARRIEGAKAKDIRARMADLDPASLPDSDAAKAIQAERARARAEQAGRAAVVEAVAQPALPAEALEPAAPPAEVLAAPVSLVDEIGPADPAGATVAEGAALAEPADHSGGELNKRLESSTELTPEPADPDPVVADLAAPAPPAEPEAQPQPATFVESVAAALDTQRRQLLAILRRVWERRAEALSAPAIEPETPAAAAPVLTDPEKLERRRQLLDAVQSGRKRAPEAAPVEAVQTPEPEAVPVPPAMPAVDPPQIDTSAARRQALDAAQAEAVEKRRREAEEDEKRRSYDLRIRQEEAQLAIQQAHEDAAQRKALAKQQSAAWRRLEQTEASRARRDQIEDSQIARSQAAEDAAAKPRGLIARLKGLLSPAAARERQEEQDRIAAQRIQDHAERQADRRERDAIARRLLTEAQARETESAAMTRAARHARELDELHQRQRDREIREQERAARERDGRGGHDDGGRGGMER